MFYSYSEPYAALEDEIKDLKEFPARVGVTLASIDQINNNLLADAFVQLYEEGKFKGQISGDSINPVLMVYSTNFPD